MKLFIRLISATLIGIVLSSGMLANAAETSIRSIRGFLPDLSFTLSSAGNQTFTEKNLRGKLAIVFFGYASCPDICPTTMAHLAQVMENLGDKSDKARIVFISVDPHRDTPDVLQEYVNLFNDKAIGLTGSEKQIQDIARRYRVAYQIEKPKDSNDKSYEVAHSRGIYIFDSEGKARLLASDGESIEGLTKAIKDLLQAS